MDKFEEWYSLAKIKVWMPQRDKFLDGLREVDDG